MLYNCNVLSKNEVEHCRKQFIDTKLKKIQTGDPLYKSKSEVVAQSPQFRNCMDVFQNAVVKKGEFNTVYLFKDISPPIFSQYDEGDFYQRHIDELLIGGIRTDHSITVFLNEPDEYDGGELRITIGDHVTDVKLRAGDAVIYPTGCLHEVLPVTRGKRQVALLWATSTIDEPFLRHEMITFAKTILAQCNKHSGDDDYLREFVYPLEQVKNNILRGYGNLQ